MIDVSNHLLTPAEMATLSGAVTAVFLSTHGLRHIFRLDPKPTGFTLSLLVSVAGIYAGTDHSLMSWLTAIPNTFIIYSAAAGVAEITGTKKRGLSGKKTNNATSNDPQQPVEEIAGASGFWRSWY
jgi:hypothetical protein